MLALKNCYNDDSFFPLDMRHRAEYRLSLRADNADIRLTKKGHEAGLVGTARMEMLREREMAVSMSINQLETFILPVRRWVTFGEAFEMGIRDGSAKTAMEVLSMPHVEMDDMEKIMQDTMAEQGKEFVRTPETAKATVEAYSKYKSYLERQEREMESWKKNQNMRIPADIVYR